MKRLDREMSFVCTLKVREDLSRTSSAQAMLNGRSRRLPSTRAFSAMTSNVGRWTLDVGHWTLDFFVSQSRIEQSAPGS